MNRAVAKLAEAMASLEERVIERKYFTFLVQCRFLSILVELKSGATNGINATRCNMKK